MVGYSVTSRATFENVGEWVNKIVRVKDIEAHILPVGVILISYPSSFIIHPSSFICGSFILCFHILFADSPSL